MEEDILQPSEEEEKDNSRLAEVFEYVESLATMFVVMLLLFVFVARPATVFGESMLPTLHEGERLFISKLFYEPKRGDIVVLANTADQQEHKNLIKRVIAVGGETIDIDFTTGEVTIDGKVLQEPYILEPTYLAEGMKFPLTIPEGEVFAMGDNRNNSRDSRSPDVGTVLEEEIVGRCLIRFLPFNRFGKVDNYREMFEQEVG